MWSCKEILKNIFKSSSKIHRDQSESKMLENLWGLLTEKFEKIHKFPFIFDFIQKLNKNDQTLLAYVCKMKTKMWKILCETKFKLKFIRLSCLLLNLLQTKLKSMGVWRIYESCRDKLKKLG